LDHFCDEKHNSSDYGLMAQIKTGRQLINDNVETDGTTSYCNYLNKVDGYKDTMEFGEFKHISNRHAPDREVENESISCTTNWKLTDVVTKTLKGNQLEKFVWFSNHTD
jgi:hypothetical protein